MHRSHFLGIFLLLSLVFCGAASAAEPRQQGATRKVPTTINSDRMDYDANGQTVVFLGAVHVVRPDFELWSDKMTVFLDNSGKSNDSSSQGGMEAGNIDRIVAEKNVRLKSGDNTGTCDKGTYYAKEDKFVMEGRPVLRDSKQSTVTGHTITHYLSSNRSQTSRGTVTFYSEDTSDAPGPSLPGSPVPRNGQR